MKTISIVGAGLVGSYTALALAKKGYSVEVFEKRTDPRTRDIRVGEGRSINLAISVRGLHALSRVGLEAETLKFAIPMRGRQMHNKDGTEIFQPYGTKDSDAINSISRGWLNAFLMTEAEKTGKVKIHFGEELESADFSARSLMFRSGKAVNYQFLLGTDGSASVLRKQIADLARSKVSSEELSHSYKEFTMESLGPAHGQTATDASPRMKQGALHIWPRGEFMVIALPNVDGSFTCTLFLRSHKHPGSTSFEDLVTPEDVHQFFHTHFADFAEKVPDFVDQYFAHPTGKMFTVKSERWCPPGFEKEVLLIGDAVHAIVPFFGQGMNCGLEDAEILVDQFEHGQAEGFQQYAEGRKPNTNAIADMAVENFVEMSAKVADPHFLFQKAVEKRLQELFPKKYISRYSMVSFSRVPYATALEVGRIQSRILNHLCQGRTRMEDVPWVEAEPLIERELQTVMRNLSWT